MYKNIINQAFKLNKNPFPWEKAISAGICGAFPIIVGLLLNQVRFGLLGAIGGFTYLYVFNEPYAQRVKKIFFVGIGITLSVILGILAAPYPILIILIVGLIGSIATFVFGTLKIPGPAAIFFVLCFTMATGVKIDKSDEFIFVAVVFASSMFCWAVSMIGYFFDPHRLEFRKIKSLYFDLIKFSEAIGENDIRDITDSMVNSLKASEDILTTGYISWKISYVFNRLVLLNKYANKMFTEMIKLQLKDKEKLPEEIVNMIKKLQVGVDIKDKITINLEKPSKKLDKKYNKLLEIIFDIEAIMNLPLEYIGHSIEIYKPSLITIFIKGVNKDSIVFANSIRYGIVLSISAIVAFNLPFTRPYWITLSCASVMCGSTIMATFNRAIQRSAGTIIGVLLAIIILGLNPQGFMVAIVNMCLIALIELLVVKNYALAAIFITPNAILIAENSTKIHDITYFATARVIDIIVGSGIALIGTYIIGHKSASSRLSSLVVKLLHSHSKLLVFLASNNDENSAIAMKEKMEIDFTNFKMAYNTALGEIPRNEGMLEIVWPVFYSLEHISYLLSQYCIEKGHLDLSDNELGQFVLFYETMCNAIEHDQDIETKNISIIKGISELCEEINRLQEALSIRKINC